MVRGLTALLVLLGGASAATATDVVRLGGPVIDNVQTLAVQHWRRWGWGGGFGHHWGWHGYRHFHHGFYRPYYDPFFHRPYYSAFYGAPYYSYFYRPYVYSGYYSYPVYSYPAYSYPVYSYPVYSSYSWAPCGGDDLVIPEAAVLGSSPAGARVERAGPILAPPGNRDGTYHYDGGPPRVVPMPGAAAPASTPPPLTKPRAGTLVSLPKAEKYSYAAYGETPPETAAPAEGVLRLVRGAAAPAYPAFGER